nr:NADH dehydrogenase subunit 3 [Glomeridesmus spelaeus]QCF39643.1 NADH dehydrogenase subunit 3 [Glomeridesmus spelaeus]
MLMIFILSIISILIPIILSILSFTITKKMTTNREKISPFECGFDPKNSARSPFSLRFFLITVIFLIFDVEIALFLPIPIIFNVSKTPLMITSSLMFILIIIFGLYIEWLNGALKWN